MLQPPLARQPAAHAPVRRRRPATPVAPPQQPSAHRAAAHEYDALAATLAGAVAQRASTRYPAGPLLARGKQAAKRRKTSGKKGTDTKAPTLSKPTTISVSLPAKHRARYTVEKFDTKACRGTRTTTVSAKVKPTKVGKRERTPIALAFGRSTPPLGFDGGHIIGLHLGGDNIPENVVPMYPRFNRGVWKAMEDKIKQLEKAVPGSVFMTVTIGYAEREPRIPETFAVAVVGDDEKPLRTSEGEPYKDDKGTPIQDTWHLSQPASIPDLRAVDGKVVTAIENAIRDTDYENEQVEKLKEAHFPTSPKDCPYGFLDVLMDEDKLDEMPGLPGRRAGNAGFNEAQRRLVLLANSIINGGPLTSDDEDDLMKDLDIRGAANAPEIDHIIPKVLGGSNYFANARVVSWHCNNKAARIKAVHHLIDVRNIAPPMLTTATAGPRLEKDVEKVAALWRAHNPGATTFGPVALANWIRHTWPGNLAPTWEKSLLPGVTRLLTTAGIPATRNEIVEAPVKDKRKRTQPRSFLDEVNLQKQREEEARRNKRNKCAKPNTTDDD